MSVVPITSEDLKSSEVAWFSALCSDDYQFLGIPDGSLEVKLGSLFKDRQDSRSSRIQKYFMPILVSSWSRYALICGRLRTNNKKYQSTCRCKMWGNAANYAW